MWLERILLQRNSRAFAPVCGKIANIRLAQPDLSAGIVKEIIEQATCRFDFGVLHRAAALLYGFLSSGADRELATQAEPWCLVGDSMLMQGDLDMAERCYARALALDGSSPRAILGEMSVALDHGELDRACERLAAAAKAAAAAGRKGLADILLAFWTLWTARAAESSVASFEVVIFSHVTGKLRKNVHLAAPGVGLVEVAFRSLKTAFAGVGADVPVTVFYDHRDTALNRAYLRALLDFCEAERIGLIVNSEHGLRRQWLHAFSRARADVILVLEQDHEFIRPCPGLSEVRELLSCRPDLNYLRINRRDNLPFLFDLALSQTPHDRKVGLSHTGRFANTPHFIRRDFYKAVINPIVKANSRRDTLNAGAGGVEENVNKVIAGVEGAIGLPATIRLFGLAIQGHLGAKALARHLGI